MFPQCAYYDGFTTVCRLAIPDYTCSPVPPHTNVSMLIRALGTYIVQPLSLPAFIEPVYCTPTKYTPVQNTYFGDIKVDVLLNTSLGRPRFSLACYCNWRFFVSLQLGKASFPFWPDNPPLQWLLLKIMSVFCSAILCLEHGNKNLTRLSFRHRTVRAHLLSFRSNVGRTELLNQSDCWNINRTSVQSRWRPSRFLAVVNQLTNYDVSIVPV